jgi:hypothetical protein
MRNLMTFSATPRRWELKWSSLSSVRSIILFLALVFGVSVVPLAHAQTDPLGPHLDTNGWTAFTPSADTHTIYVSNRSGKDTNDGRSERLPVKTIAKGVSLLRDGYPDWLLLKKGDTWTDEGFSWFFNSGRSAREPMLISSYGTGARPLIKTRSTSPAIGSFGAGGNRGGNFIALVGIEFYAYTRDPSSPDFIASGAGNKQQGVFFLNPSSWVLVEDCKLSFYADDLAFEMGPAQYVALRRNIIVDAYSADSHSQGIFADNVVKLLLEENIFDHNGWNDSAGASATIFNHNVYLQGLAYSPKTVSGPAIIKGNIIANASSHGVQLRGGGEVTDNLFVHNPIGLLVLSPASVSDNVFLSGNDIAASIPRGFAIDANPPIGPIQITNNIVAHEDSSGRVGHGIALNAGTADVTADNNIIYKWDNPLIDNGTGNISSPNDINATGYGDPSRTVETYNVSLGGTSKLSDFLQEARKQSKDNWRPQYTAKNVNDYIRAGFERK